MFLQPHLLYNSLMQIDVTSVEFLNVQAVSVLVCYVPQSTEPALMKRLRSALLEKNLPNVVDVLVVSDAMKLAVISIAEAQAV